LCPCVRAAGLAHRLSCRRGPPRARLRRPDRERRLSRGGRGYSWTAPFRLRRRQQASLARPEPGDEFLPRGQLVDRKSKLPEARPDLGRQLVIDPVRPRDLGKNVPQLNQRQLVLGHVSEKRLQRSRDRLAPSPTPDVAG